MICTSKTCFKCSVEKPLDEFYPHGRMTDGYLNKCKECARRDACASYRRHLNERKEYERLRNKDPHRKEMKLRYQIKSRLEHPDRYKARCAVHNAIRDGRLVKQPCCYCGAKDVEAHHPDYSKPLKVRWMCFPCHRTIEHGQDLS